MGHRFRLALKLARDPRFKRLTCLHKGTYADDCLVQRVTEVRLLRSLAFPINCDMELYNIFSINATLLLQMTKI